MITSKLYRCALLSMFVCFSLSAVDLGAAPTPAPKQAPPESEPSKEIISEPAVPKDIKPGDGIKEKKLSTIFESFVPSEDISADNAVPFPVDI